MTTPLTIMSLSQGRLSDKPRSEVEYWERHADEPLLEDLPFWHAMKVEWPRWSLRRRTDHG